MRTRWAWRGALVALSLVVAGTVAPGVASAASPPPDYPVVWSFLTTAIFAASENGPNVAPPGSNVPCTPSPAHPDPVVLVHGLAANQNDNWQTMSPYLADHGYCVFSLTYGNMANLPRPLDEIGGLTDMESSAHVWPSSWTGSSPPPTQRRSTSWATPRAAPCPTTTSSSSGAHRRSRTS